MTSNTETCEVCGGGFPDEYGKFSPRAPVYADEYVYHLGCEDRVFVSIDDTCDYRITTMTEYTREELIEAAAETIRRSEEFEGRIRKGIQHGTVLMLGEMLGEAMSPADVLAVAENTSDS
jgi:hypothetical protein